MPELQSEVHLIKVGEKVGASEAALLNMLGIKPFSYGLVVRQVYDSGTMFSPDVLDITTETLRANFMLVSLSLVLLIYWIMLIITVLIQNLTFLHTNC